MCVGEAGSTRLLTLLEADIVWETDYHTDRQAGGLSAQPNNTDRLLLLLLVACCCRFSVASLALPLLLLLLLYIGCLPGSAKRHHGGWQCWVLPQVH